MTSATKSAGLGWGQRYMWLRHHQQPEDDRHDPNLVMTCHIKQAIPLAKLRAIVNSVVRRHEALRTTYHHDTGGDPVQRVHPPAAVPMPAVTTERDGTPAPAEVVAELGRRAFDLAAEWPIRACAITTAGVPKHLILVFNHMSIDRWTVTRIDHDLAVLYAAVCAGRPATLEPVEHQPLDLVRYESSAEALEGSARALSWWRTEIAKLPADLMAPRREPIANATAHELTLTSPAILAASRDIAARHGVWPSAVHLTAYNAMMAAYFGAATVSSLCFASNRESSRYAGVLTCLFSPQLMRVDCAGDPTFGELLCRVAHTFEQAQRHSYIPYDAAVELLARESEQRGQAVRIGAEVNLVGEPAKESRVKHSTLIRKPGASAWASYGADTYLRITEWRDAVGIALSASSAVLDAEAVERFLRGYERIVLDYHERAANPRISELAAAAGFTAPAGRAVRLRGEFVDLEQVAAVLLAHPAVQDAQLSTTDSEELIASVLAEPPVTPAELRTHVLGHLDRPYAVRCPSRFRIVSRSGAHTEGSGHDAGHAPASGPAERALAEAVCRVNGFDTVSMARSYPAAGGRVLRIPRVLALLAEHGWRGVLVYQLASAVPLRSLAARLARTEPALTDVGRPAVGADLARI